MRLRLPTRSNLGTFPLGQDLQVERRTPAVPDQGPSSQKDGEARPCRAIHHAVRLQPPDGSSPTRPRTGETGRLLSSPKFGGLEILRPSPGDLVGAGGPRDSRSGHACGWPRQHSRAFLKGVPAPIQGESSVLEPHQTTCSG